MQEATDESSSENEYVEDYVCDLLCGIFHCDNTESRVDGFDTVGLPEREKVPKSRRRFAAEDFSGTSSDDDISSRQSRQNDHPVVSDRTVDKKDLKAAHETVLRIRQRRGGKNGVSVERGFLGKYHTAPSTMSSVDHTPNKNGSGGKPSLAAQGDCSPSTRTNNAGTLGRPSPAAQEDRSSSSRWSDNDEHHGFHPKSSNEPALAAEKGAGEDVVDGARHEPSASSHWSDEDAHHSFLGGKGGA
jgi:hypothetical protein